MKKYNYRVSYGTPSRDVYTTLATSTTRNPHKALTEVIDEVYKQAIENGELQIGEFPIGLSILFVGEVSDNVIQKCDDVTLSGQEVSLNG